MHIHIQINENIGILKISHTGGLIWYDGFKFTQVVYINIEIGVCVCVFDTEKVCMYYIRLHEPAVYKI